MAWVLVPSLVALRSEFNAVSPGRDKGADGSIGDSNHTSSSDHTPDEDSSVLRNKDSDNINEVHALDIDSTGPWPSPGWFGETIEHIRQDEKRKWLSSNDRSRLSYIIYNHQIASTTTDFEWRTYNGSDPHTNHAHFSNRYETACENDTRPWGVEDMPLTNEDINRIADKVFERLTVSGYWPDGSNASLPDAVRSAGQRALNTYNLVKDGTSAK